MTKLSFTRGWRRNLPIGFAGGGLLMSVAAVAQSISFGFNNLSWISLGTPFVLGTLATCAMLQLMQRSLDEQRRRLDHEFRGRTSELVETEKRFKEYSEAAKEWFWETDTEDRIVFLSSRLYEASGIRPEEILGRKRESLITEPLSDADREMWASYRHRIENRLPYEDLRYKSRAADGSEIVYCSSGKPFFDDDGNFSGYRGTARNATREVVEERRQRAGQDLIYNATAVLSDGFYIFDADDRLMMCNRSFKEIYASVADILEPGVSYEEILRAIAEQQIVFASDEEKRDWLESTLADHADPGEPFEEHLVTGEWIRVVKQRMVDGGVVGLCIDISANKRIEDELAEAQRISNIGSYRQNFQTDEMLSYSDQMAKIYGLGRDEIDGQENSYMYDRVHPEDRERVRATYEQARLSGVSSPGAVLFEIEYRIIQPDGSLRNVLERADVSRTSNGRVVEIIGTLQDMTDKRRIEQDLEEAQSIASMASFRWDLDLERLTWCSDEYLNIMGQSREQALAPDADKFGLVHHEDRPMVMKFYQNLATAPENTDIEYRVLREDGQLRYVIERYKSRGMSSGNQRELIGTIQDITRLKTFEQELEDAQHLARIGSFRWDTQHQHIISCTAEYLNILGRDPATIPGQDDDPFQLVHPDDMERLLEAYRRRDDEDIEVEYRILRQDGEVRYVNERLRPLLWRNGVLVEQIGTIQDVTERKLLELNLEEAQKIAKIGSFRWDVVNDRMISCTREFQRIYELSDDLLSLSPEQQLRKFCHPDDLQRVLEAYAKSKQSNEVVEIEYRSILEDGRVRYLIERLASSFWRDGKIVEQIGTLQDVTRQKLAQMEKQESETMLEAAIENVPGGFLMVGRDGLIVRFNRRFFDLYPQQQFYINEGLPFERFLEFGIEHGVYDEAIDDPDSWKKNRLERVNTRQIEFFERLSDGRTIQVASRLLPDGTRVGIHVDVTELENARLAAEQANAAKSDFLASMSHELRTPMHGILSFAELGIKRMETLSQEKLSQYLENIQISGNRLLILLNDLLDLSKLEAGKMSLDITALNLVDLVQACINEQSLRLRENSLTCELVSGETDARCLCDRNRIHQVVSNVIVNAIKFSPEGGCIEIGIEQVGSGFRVGIADQGVGIPENDLDQIFDKFYQSAHNRNYRGGTGLGLAICREIIELHGGRIWAENNAGDGSRILFEIPDEGQSN